MRMFDSQFALCTFVKRKSIYKINIHENVKTLFKISKLELLAKKKQMDFVVMMRAEYLLYGK